MIKGLDSLKCMATPDRNPRTEPATLDSISMGGGIVIIIEVCLPQHTKARRYACNDDKDHPSPSQVICLSSL
jgi:hypothetical protein